jgi:hypothetical protein
LLDGEAENDALEERPEDHDAVDEPSQDRTHLLRQADISYELMIFRRTRRIRRKSTNIERSWNELDLGVVPVDSSKDDGDDVTQIHGKSGDGEDGIESDRAGKVEETEEGRASDDDPDGVDGSLRTSVDLAEEAKVRETVVSTGCRDGTK